MIARILQYYNHDIIIITNIANCGTPSPPINGHILPYTSTLEGAVVTIRCFSDGMDENQTIVCPHHGIWEPNSVVSCGIGPGLDSDN